MGIRGRSSPAFGHKQTSCGAIQLLSVSDSNAANDKSKLGTSFCNFNLIMSIDESERKTYIRNYLI